jgi:HK97 family phage major capsid protein
MTKTLTEQLAPVFEESDKRYAPISTVDNIQRQIAEMKAAPAFVSQETRQRGNTIPELSLGRLTSAFVKKRIDGEFPGGKEFTKEVEYLRKAFASGTTTAGGFLIPEDWENLVIQELGAKAVVLAAGPNMIPCVGKKQHLGGFGADATAQWLGEGTGSTESTPATTDVSLQLQTARLLSSFSVEWLNYSSPAIDAAFQANLVRSLQRFIDAALLSGSGANRPTGMRTVAGATNVGAAASNVNGGAVTYDDFVLLLDALDAADVGMENRAWFMNPRSWTRLRQLKDTTGRPLVYDYSLPLRQGDVLQLFGYPVYRSTKMPKNEAKGTGTNLTSILCVDMNDIYVGVGTGQSGIRIDVSEHSQFANAQIQVRLLFQTDIQPGHAVSIGVLDGVA